MTGKTEIPLEVLKQFQVEHNPQYLGYEPGAIAALDQIASNGQGTVDYSTVTQQMQPAQNTVSRCVMTETMFISEFQGSNNPNRSYLLIQNQGAGAMYVSIGTKSASGRGFEIGVGGYWEPPCVPINSFSITGSGVVMEGTSV